MRSLLSVIVCMYTTISMCVSIKEDEGMGQRERGARERGDNRGEEGGGRRQREGVERERKKETQRERKKERAREE